MTEHMERRMDEMCNLSDGVMEAGIQKGIQQGLSIGEKTGGLKVLVGLVERGLLSSIDAAKEADMSEEEFTAILQQSRFV